VFKSVHNFVRIRKGHFKGLFDTGEARDVFASPMVANCRIEFGEIRATLNWPFAPRALEDHPDLFLSFAHLGADRETRDAAIKGWVKKYGLPTEGVDQTGMKPGERTMLVENFKAEARDANRLLTLYAEIRRREVAAIRSRVKHPRSPLDEDLKVAFASASHRTLLGHLALLGVLGAQSVDFSADDVKLFTSMQVLCRAVDEKVERVRLRLAPQDGSRVRQSYYCPDLLSALYLQLNLLISDRRAVSYCEFCHTPFPYRKGKRFCDNKCRRKEWTERNNADTH
jgi:hypothetical protein